MRDYVSLAGLLTRELDRRLWGEKWRTGGPFGVDNGEAACAPLPLRDRQEIRCQPPCDRRYRKEKPA